MKVINLFAGPGAGKSTTAAGLFHLMKIDDLKVELVTEFAKDLTYEAHPGIAFQPYVLGNQAWRIERLKDQVDYVITDSPVLLSAIYGTTDEVRRLAWKLHGEFETANVLVRRVKPYRAYGRGQDEEEARQLDRAISTILSADRGGVLEVDGDYSAPRSILEHLRLANFIKEPPCV